MGRSFSRIHAWRGSTVSTKVDTHQQQQEVDAYEQQTVDHPSTAA
jgi:hypothetical protein